MGDENMSDFITFDTESNIVKEEVINPYELMLEGHPCLKQEISEYDIKLLPNAAIKKIVNRMKVTMSTYNGLGLSGPQCGVMERIFIIGTNDFQMVCINPEIIQTSGQYQKQREGCLSYPGLYLYVERYNKIYVRFWTEVGEMKEVWLEGVTAQCFQHELDHLDGVCYDENVKPVAMAMARKRQQKLIKRIGKNR